MLKLTENNKQLGTVEVSVAHRFSVGLQNTGREKLSISRIQPHCGSCTSALALNNEIPAGGSTVLNIVFTPTSTAFQTTKGIDIYFNGPDLQSEKITYSFSAKVI